MSRSAVRSIAKRRLVPIIILAIVLMLALSATALAATPANNGAGQAFGLHHAECAQAGMLGADMNPGKHRGMSGWMGPCPIP